MRSTLSDMQVVLWLDETGSIAGTAQRAGVASSSISRQLARLEERLGVRLVQRNTRSLKLTDSGLRYRDHARRLLNELLTAELDVTEGRDVPRGMLRVSASEMYGQQVVSVAVARLVKAYPELRVDLVVNDRMVDLMKEGFDVAVRIADHLPSTGLMAKKIGTQHHVLCASPSYLEDLPSVERIEDLSQHRCVEFSHDANRGRWRLRVRGKIRRVAVESSLSVNTVLGVYRSTLAGAGIGVLPACLVKSDIDAGRLTRILPKVDAPPKTIWAVHATGRMPAASIQAFMTVLAEVEKNNA